MPRSPRSANLPGRLPLTEETAGTAAYPWERGPGDG